MQINLEYIEKLAKILKENNLGEITVENEENVISIKRENSFCSAPISAQVDSRVVSIPVVKSPVLNQEEKHKGKPVTAPMVGTFYSAPSPDEPPFVNVGDTVSQGQVICIIEAMKLMNEIEAEQQGKITEICVKNGDSVEFGQVLMYIE